MTPQEFKLKIDNLPDEVSRIRVEDVNVLRGDVDRVSSFSSEQKTKIKEYLAILAAGSRPKAKRTTFGKLKALLNEIVPENSSSNETPTEEESDSSVVLAREEAKARIRKLRKRVLEERLRTFERKSATVQAQSGDVSRGEFAVGPKIGPRVRNISTMKSVLNDPNSNLDQVANFLDEVEAENRKKSIVGYNFESDEREEKIYREKMEQRLRLLDVSSQKLFNSLVERMGFLSPEDFEQKIGEVIRKIPEYQTLVDEATKDMSNEDKEIFIEYLGSMDKATGTIEEFNGAVVKAMENFPKVSEKFKEAVEGLSSEEKTIARKRIISYSPSEISSEVTSLKEREDLGSVERNARDLIYDEEVGLDPKQKTMFRKEASAKIKPLLSGKIGISEFEKLIIKIRSRYKKDIFIPEAGEQFKETVVGGAIYETKKEVDRGRYTELEAFVRQQTEELFRGSTLQKTILVLFKGRLGMVLSGAVGVVRKLLGVFGSLAGALGSLVTSIVEFTKKIVSTTMSIGWSLLKWIGILTLLYKTGLLQKIGPFITEFLRTITPFLLDVVKSVFSAMNDFLESAIESLAGGVGGEAWGRKLKDFFFGREGLFSTEVARKTGEELKRFFRNIRNILPILGTVVKDMINGIVTIMKDFVYPEIIKPLLSSFFEWMETDGLGQKFKEYVYDPVTSLAKAVWWIGKKIAWIIENPILAFGIYAGASILYRSMAAAAAAGVAAGMRSAAFMQFAGMPGKGLGKVGGFMNMLLPAAVFGGAGTASGALGGGGGGGGGGGPAAASVSSTSGAAVGGQATKGTFRQALNNTGQFMPTAGQRGFTAPIARGAASLGRTGMLLSYGETALTTGVDAYGQIQQGDYGDAAATVGAGIGKAGATWAGAKLGAAIGTVAIPIPGLGTALGGLVGGALGYWAGDTMYESITQALDEDELSEEEKEYLDSIDTSLKDMNKRDRDEALRKIRAAKDSKEIFEHLTSLIETQKQDPPSLGQLLASSITQQGSSGNPTIPINEKGVEYYYDMVLRNRNYQQNIATFFRERVSAYLRDDPNDPDVANKVLDEYINSVAGGADLDTKRQLRNIVGSVITELVNSSSGNQPFSRTHRDSNNTLANILLHEHLKGGFDDSSTREFYDGGTILPKNSAVVIEDETAVNIHGQPAIVGDRDPKSPGMPNPELMVNSESGTTILPLNDPMGRKILEEYGNSRKKRFADGGVVMSGAYDLGSNDTVKDEKDVVEGIVSEMFEVAVQYKKTNDEKLIDQFDRLRASLENFGYEVKVTGENINDLRIELTKESVPYRELDHDVLPVSRNPSGKLNTPSPTKRSPAPPNPTGNLPSPTTWKPLPNSPDTTLPAEPAEHLEDALENQTEATENQTEAIEKQTEQVEKNLSLSSSINAGALGEILGYRIGGNSGDSVGTGSAGGAGGAGGGGAGGGGAGGPGKTFKIPRAGDILYGSVGDGAGGGKSSKGAKVPANPDADELWKQWKNLQVSIEVSTFSGDDVDDPKVRKIMSSISARKKQIIADITALYKKAGFNDEKAIKNKMGELIKEARKEARVIVDKAGTRGGAKSFSLKDPIVELEQLQKQRQEQEGKLKTLDEIDAAEGRVETMEKRNIEIAGKIAGGDLESFFKKKEENQEALTELNKVSSKADDEKSQQGIEKLEKTEEYVALLKKKKDGTLGDEGAKILAELAKELNLPKMEDGEAAIAMMTERSESLKKSLGDLAEEGSAARKELDVRREKRSELEGDLDKARQYESMMGEMRSNTEKITRDRTFLAQNADLASRKEHERDMINMELQRIDGESSFYGGKPGTERGVDMMAAARMAQEQKKSEERAVSIRSLSGTKRSIIGEITKLNREDQEFTRLAADDERDSIRLAELETDRGEDMKEYSEYKFLKEQEKKDESLALEIAELSKDPKALANDETKKYIEDSKKKLEENNKRRKELYPKFEGEGSEERVAEIEGVINEVAGLKSKAERLDYLYQTEEDRNKESKELADRLNSVQENLDSLIKEDAAYGASLASGSQYFDPSADNSARFKQIALEQGQVGSFEKADMATASANLLGQSADSLQEMLAAGTVMDKEEADYSAKGYADSEDRISAALQYMTPEDRERFETLMASIKGGGRERRNFAQRSSKFNYLDKTKEQRKKELEFLDTKMKSGAELTESERKKYEQLQSSEEEYSKLSAWRESEQYAKSAIDYDLESKRRSEIQSISGKYGIDSSSLMRDLGGESVDPSGKTEEWKPSDLTPDDTMRGAPVGETQAQGTVVINHIVGGSTNNQMMTAAPSTPPIVIAPAKTSSSQAVLGRDSSATPGY